MHLAAAISLQEVVGQVLTEYALRQPLVLVRAVFGSSNELADHLLAGAPCDLFISADPTHLDRLEASGLLEPGDRRTLALNGLAAIGPPSGTTCARKARDLLSDEIKHVALADPACPLGKLTQAYLQSIDLEASDPPEGDLCGQFTRRAGGRAVGRRRGGSGIRQRRRQGRPVRNVVSSDCSPGLGGMCGGRSPLCA